MEAHLPSEASLATVVPSALPLPTAMQSESPAPVPLPTVVPLELSTDLCY